MFSIPIGLRIAYLVRKDYDVNMESLYIKSVSLYLFIRMLVGTVLVRA